MTLGKSARDALYAAVEMALSADEPVTAAGVARRHGLSATVLAKVLQQLVRAGIAVGARGVGGGYRLSRPASAISVLDVIAVFEGSRFPGYSAHTGRPGEPGQTPVDASLRQLFDEVDDLARSTYASVTLETLARQAARAAAEAVAAGKT